MYVVSGHPLYSPCRKGGCGCDDAGRGCKSRYRGPNFSGAVPDHQHRILQDMTLIFRRVLALAPK